MTRTTIGLLAADALLWLVSAGPVALGASVVSRVLGIDPGLGAFAALVVWTLSSAVMFIRPVELRVAKLLFGAREPTDAELARLRPAWERVCLKAREDLGDYVLRVEDRNEVNATAGGARIVAVTTLALELPDEELSALLAHELGHHLDEHPTAALLSWWFALPSLAFDAILRLAAHLAWALILVRVVFLLPLLLARLASAVLNRAAEFAADRHAARLGYGPALVRIFQRFVEQGHDEEEAADDGPGRLWATHPPLRDRIARLEAAGAPT